MGSEAGASALPLPVCLVWQPEGRMQAAPAHDPKLLALDRACRRLSGCGEMKTSENLGKTIAKTRSEGPEGQQQGEKAQQRP